MNDNIIRLDDHRYELQYHVSVRGSALYIIHDNPITYLCKYNDRPFTIKLGTRYYVIDALSSSSPSQYIHTMASVVSLVQPTSIIVSYRAPNTPRRLYTTFPVFESTSGKTNTGAYLNPRYKISK